MNVERVIKVVHYSKPGGHAFNDRLSIEFSPSELTSLMIHFTKQALIAEEYGKQTEMREMRESFSRAYAMWNDCKEDNV